MIGYRHALISAGIALIDKLIEAPIFQISEVVSISSDSCIFSIKSNSNCDVVIAALPSKYASKNDVDNALVKVTQSLIANQYTEVTVSGLTLSTEYYLSFYGTNSAGIDSFVQRSIRIKTLAIGVKRAVFVIDMVNSPEVTVDGSNRISRIKSNTNNYCLQNFTNTTKPTFVNNSIISNESTQGMRIQPFPVINKTFTIAIVGNQKTNPVWFAACRAKYFSTVNPYIFLNTPLQVRNSMQDPLNYQDLVDLNKRNQTLGEHVFIATANGTTLSLYRDGVLMLSMPVTTFSLRELTTIAGTNYVNYTPLIRYMSVSHDFTSDIATLNASLQQFLTGNQAPVASNIFYSTLTPIVGESISVTGYTYSDAESNPQSTVLYWWRYSKNNGLTWVDVDGNSSTASYTIPVGYAGRLLRCGVLVTSNAGNYSSGDYTWGSTLTVG